MISEALIRPESAIQGLGDRIGDWIERQFEKGKLGGIKKADLLKLGFLGAGVLASLISHIQNGLPENSSEVADLLSQYGSEGGQAKMVVMLERNWTATIVEGQGRDEIQKPGHPHGLKQIAILVGPGSPEMEKQTGAFDRVLVALRITPPEERPWLVVAVTTKQNSPKISRPAEKKELEFFALLAQESRGLLEEI